MEFKLGTHIRGQGYEKLEIVSIDKALPTMILDDSFIWAHDFEPEVELHQDNQFQSHLKGLVRAH